MKRAAWFSAALALAFALPTTARAETYFGFSIGISNAPPPHVVFYDEPSYYAVPGYSVYVVEDCPYDMFRYGSSYYLYDDGYWFRGASYGGPFRACDVRYVPRSVLRVPARHWRHRSSGHYSNWDRGYRDDGYRYRATARYRDDGYRNNRYRDDGYRTGRGDRTWAREKSYRDYQGRNRDWQNRNGRDRVVRERSRGYDDRLAYRDDGGRRGGDRDRGWRSGDSRGDQRGKGSRKSKGKHRGDD